MTFGHVDIDYVMRAAFFWSFFVEYKSRIIKVRLFVTWRLG